MTGPVMLPERRGTKFDTPHMLDWGGQLVPPLGGVVQTLERIGTRHAIDITIPLMRAEPDGREWSARLRMAKLYGAMAVYRQDGFRVGVPGSPVVDGAGQAGSVLKLRGLTRGYPLKLGQAFSLVHGGWRYLHFVAALAIADDSGRATVPIFPMLRFITVNGSAAEVAKPIIQGSLQGNEVKWTRLAAPFHDFGTITIREDR